MPFCFFKGLMRHAVDHSACGLHDQPVSHSSGWNDLIWVQNVFWLTFSPASLPETSLASSTPEAPFIVAGQACHHWHAYCWSFRSDSQSPNRHPLDQEQQLNSLEFSKIFHLTNMNLTIKNLKKIALHFKNLLRSFVTEQDPKCCQKTSTQAHGSVVWGHCWTRWPSSQSFSSQGSDQSTIIKFTASIVINVNLSTSTSTSSSTWVSNAPCTSSIASSPFSTARATSAPATTPAVRLATRSGQKKNHKEAKTQRLNRSSTSSSRHQRQSSPHQSGSNQCRSSASSIRRRVASRSHSSGVVSRGSSGILSRSDQVNNHQRAQTDWSSRSWCLWPHSAQQSHSKNVGWSIIESRWVIGSRPGSELKGRFCAKGFKQVISRDDKYASIPQSTTLKCILLMSQIHQWEIAVSDIASAFLNTPVDPLKSTVFVHAPRELQYAEPMVGLPLETQTSVVWSQGCSQNMASSFISEHDHQQRHGSDEVRLTYLPQERSLGSWSACGHGLCGWPSHCG